MSAPGIAALAAWVLLGWLPALLIAREYAQDPSYGEGTTGFMFVGSWVMLPVVLPIVAIGWLTIRAGRMIEARWGVEK